MSGAFLTYLAQMESPIQNLAGFAAQLQNSRGGVERVLEILHVIGVVGPERTPQRHDDVLLGIDRVAQLGTALEAGSIELEEDGKFGLLPAVLKALDIPEQSQTLVFSKTL